MVVFSPLSLYTTYLGWQQYDVIFNALLQTGLLYFGFLKIGFRYLKNILIPAGSTHNAGEYALNCFIYELILAFLICAFFVYPCAPLEEKGMTFKPMCGVKKGSDPVASTLRDTGTTYDESFADLLAPNVKMPIGFSILQDYMSSTTYGLMKVTGCSDSLKAIDSDLVSIYLPDDIREQALTFHRQCYLEARNQFQNEPVDRQKVDEILKNYNGDEDLKWMGSQVFQSLYYPKLYARQPVKGFTYAEAPNKNLDDAVKRGDFDQSRLPADGYPSCKAWWLKLRKDLVKTVDNSSVFDRHLNYVDVHNRVNEYKKSHPKAWGSKLTADDYVARMVLISSKDLQFNSMKNAMNTTNGAVASVISHNLYNAGQWTKSIVSAPLKREAIMQTLPIMQGYLYFFLIIICLFVLALSGYSARALGSFIGLFIMTILLNYLWHLVGYLERSVLDPLGDDEAISAMRNLALAFYFIAPMLLLRVSSHFGGEAGMALAGLVASSSEAADQGAKAGGEVVKRAAGTANAASRLFR